MECAQVDRGREMVNKWDNLMEVWEMISLEQNLADKRDDKGPSRQWGEHLTCLRGRKRYDRYGRTFEWLSQWGVNQSLAGNQNNVGGKRGIFIMNNRKILIQEGIGNPLRDLRKKISVVKILREVASRTCAGGERRGYCPEDVWRATSGEKCKSCEIQMVSHFPAQRDQHLFPLYLWIF